MGWDPAQYRRFASERAAPFHDLCDLVDQIGGSTVRRGVDLGCGTGELTLAAADRFDAAVMVGLDASPSMLAAARRLDLGPRADRVSFVEGDLATWTSASDHDLVVANASLHWVADHPGVLARWVAALAPGGRLAVQVPANSDHPVHRAAADVAAREPYHGALGGPPPPDPVAVNVLAPEVYAEVLHDLGLTAVHVRLQVYLHLLDDVAAAVDWIRGATLTRILGRLPEEMHEPYVADCVAEALRRVGSRSPYPFTFRRVLMAGRRDRRRAGADG